MIASSDVPSLAFDGLDDAVRAARGGTAAIHRATAGARGAVRRRTPGLRRAPRPQRLDRRVIGLPQSRSPRASRTDPPRSSPPSCSAASPSVTPGVGGSSGLADAAGGWRRVGCPDDLMVGAGGLVERSSSPSGIHADHVEHCGPQCAADEPPAQRIGRELADRCATALFGAVRRAARRRRPASGAGSRDPHRRRHRVRRRRDRGGLRPARDDEPPHAPGSFTCSATAAGRTRGPASSGSAGSPSWASRRSTSASGSRRCRSSATASP
jgi:hypothetical protein